MCTLGLQRRHAHGSSNAIKVQNADLSGPHPEAVGTNYAYMLVAVFKGSRSKTNLPFVRGQTTQTATYTNESIESVLANMHCLVGEQLVVRCHSDAIDNYFFKK